MLESGIATDIITGRPVDEKARKKRIKATQGYRDAVSEATNLAIELQNGNPVVTLLAKQYMDRLIALATHDSECQSIERILQSLNTTLEIRPIMAEKRMRNVVGPNLEGFINLEAEAAP